MVMIKPKHFSHNFSPSTISVKPTKIDRKRNANTNNISYP